MMQQYISGINISPWSEINISSNSEIDISSWKEKYPNTFIKIVYNNAGQEELLIVKKLHISKARKKHEKQNYEHLNLEGLNNINDISKKQINIPYNTRPRRLSKQDEEQRQRMFEISRIENRGKRIYNRNMNHPDDFSGWRDRSIYISTGSNGVPVVKYTNYKVKHGGAGIKHISLANAEIIQKERLRMNTHGAEKKKQIEVVKIRMGAKEIEKIIHEAK